MDKKKIIIISSVAIILIIAIIATIVFVSNNSEKEESDDSPQSIVREYISAMSEHNASKLAKLVDPIGEKAWIRCDRKEDAFIDAYNEVKNEEDREDLIDNNEENYEDLFDSLEDEYDSYRAKIKKNKGTKKLMEDLYEVKVQVEINTVDKDGEKYEDTDTINFIVYKNKIISQE